MKTKILLVNFRPDEAHELVEAGLHVDFGFFGEKIPGEEPLFDFPLSIYEYRIAFIKLGKGGAVPPKNAIRLLKAHSEDFGKYWKKRGLLVFFLDNTEYDSLSVFGMPYINLIKAKSIDETIKFVMDKPESSFRRALKEIQPHLLIPPTTYISLKSIDSDYLRECYINKNDNIVGGSLDASRYRFDGDRPNILVLPRLKKYSQVLLKLTQGIASIYDGFVPEVRSSEWTGEDGFYPKSVKRIDDEISNVIKNAEKQKEILEKQKQDLKDKYVFLKNLVTLSGDELKDAVIVALAEVFEINVTDVDATKKTEFKEDVFFVVKGQKFLGEIKGTEAVNPKHSFVTQLFGHIQKSPHKDAVGVLFLNHDLKKAPDERPNAYSDEDGNELIRDIVFIDTRVLLSLCLAIIDNEISIQDAQDKLFQKGRIEFP